MCLGALMSKIAFPLFASLILLTSCGERVTRPAGNDIPIRDGHTFRDCEDCPTMIVLTGSTVSVGLDNGGTGWPNPSRLVRVGSFAMSMNAVSEAEYEICRSDRSCGSRAVDVGDARVTWQEAEQYVRWLSNKTGREYRLVSEAEWEFAAVAKSSILGGRIHDRQQASGQGDVREWTADCWHRGYDGAPEDGVAWTADCDTTHGDTRVLRGDGSPYNRDGHETTGYFARFRVATTLPAA